VPREVQTRPISADFRRTQQRIFASKTEWRSEVNSNCRYRFSQLKIDPAAKGLVAGDADLAEADRNLLKVPLQALATPLEMGAWGTAQAAQGTYVSPKRR
jgi:hypothetical protein